MNLLDFYAEQLDGLKATGNFRSFRDNQQQGSQIIINGRAMLNLSSNDYLGLAAQHYLLDDFLQQTDPELLRLSASSSRLLTGHFAVYDALEQDLSLAFARRAALLFNSGYHMNIGILPALADSRSIILADKLVHASLIDGMRLAAAKSVRYRHNDLEHLAQLLAQYQDNSDIDRIFVVTESIFSMDGDETDLIALVALKQRFSKVLLYVDDAHGIGVRGARGLGCAEQYNVIEQIDLLAGTFGKALASQGAYVICAPILKAFLINRARSLIYSTALPPLNIAWTRYIFNYMQDLHTERAQLEHLGQHLRASLPNKGYGSTSSSHIVPMIVGESQAAVALATRLQQSGFYALPVRPPTVPQHRARLRICLNATLETAQLDALLDVL